MSRRRTKYPCLLIKTLEDLSTKGTMETRIALGCRGLHPALDPNHDHIKGQKDCHRTLAL